MESEATPRDDREQGTSARDKFESRACLRGGWEVEQYAHRLGAVVSQFIVDSLGCPSQDNAGKLIGELAAGLLLHLRSSNRHL